MSAPTERPKTVPDDRWEAFSSLEKAFLFVGLCAAGYDRNALALRDELIIELNWEVAISPPFKRILEELARAAGAPRALEVLRWSGVLK